MMLDSSMARPQIQLEAIKEAISNGRLDAETIHQTMLAQIMNELEKPVEEVDMDFVNACEELLTALNRGRATSVESHYSRNLEVIRSKLRRRFALPVSVRPLRLGIACCLVLLVIFGSLLLSQEKVHVSVSTDQEQLIIQGERASEGTVSHADGGNPGFQETQGTYDTENREKAVSLYGSIPRFPQWVPEGWEVFLYSVDILESSRSITVIYQRDKTNGSLVCSEKVYANIGAYRTEIEQNELGHTVVLGNKTTVYITNNYELTTARWQQGNTQYTIYGPIAEDDLLHCIESTELQMEE